MKQLLSIALLLPSLLFASDGIGVPAKTWFLGFGNSPVFTGLRFNFSDKNIEKVNGLSFTIWQPKGESGDGVVNGISLGLPLAGGTAQRNGLNVGVGVSAGESINGVNIGGLGAGAGGDVNGVSIGGLGIGSGGSLKGINLAGLGLGSGESVIGINVAGLGVGAGEELTGINVAGLGIGSGSDIKGVNVALVGVGAGDNATGLNIGGVGMGAGGEVRGINIGGVGVGAGEAVVGLNIAVVAVGAPEVKGVSVAAVVGGNEVTGLALAPAWVKIGDKGDAQDNALRGVAISAFNQIRGENNGVSIGIVNFAKGGKGFQIGLLNHNPDNPKGLRWLPFFSANFGKEKE